jgi:hypothetical protein
VDISGNLPDVPVWSVLMDPRFPNVLYIGSDNGVWQTTSLGTANITWNRFGVGDPIAQVNQMILDPVHNTITASTWGRGAYIVKLGRPVSPGAVSTLSTTPDAPTAPSEAVAAGSTNGLGLFPDILLMPSVPHAGDSFLLAGNATFGGQGAGFPWATPVNPSVLPNSGVASTSGTGSSLVSSKLVGPALGTLLPTPAVALTGGGSEESKQNATANSGLDPHASDALFASLAESYTETKTVTIKLGS